MHLVHSELGKQLIEDHEETSTYNDSPAKTGKEDERVNKSPVPHHVTITPGTWNPSCPYYAPHPHPDPDFCLTPYDKESIVLRKRNRIDSGLCFGCAK